MCRRKRGWHLVDLADEAAHRPQGLGARGRLLDRYRRNVAVGVVAVAACAQPQARAIHLEHVLHILGQTGGGADAQYQDTRGQGVERPGVPDSGAAWKPAQRSVYNGARRHAAGLVQNEQTVIRRWHHPWALESLWRLALNHPGKWCVIFNPVAARGRAERRARELQAALGPHVELRATRHPGHAEELACDAAGNGFQLVAAAGGDGTVHEVANGILKSQRTDVLFGVLPLGSANDYAFSLHKSFGDRQAAQQGHPVDVGWVKGDDGRERYFVNTLGLGFSGAVTVESRRIRRLQGLALYGVAFLRALWYRYSCPVMQCTFDGQTREAPTLSLTLALGHREGSFIVAPEARLDDGLFDYLHAGQLARWEVLRYMPKLASGGQLPTDHPALWLGRCRELRLQSAAPLTIHLDGEFFCRPEDNLRGIEVRLLPAALRVRTVNPASIP